MKEAHGVRKGCVVAMACCLVTAQSKCAQSTGGTTSLAASGQGARGAAQAESGANAAGYRIAGVIVDAGTGAPVAGAELSIAEAKLEMKVTADGEGRFVFAGVEPGKYPLNASAPGYVREAYDEHWGFSTGIVVGNGLDSEHLVFRLHRQAVITGTVTNERGEAVREAQVMLFVEERSGGKPEVRMLSQMPTNDLGAYRFAHLRAGKYYVAVTARPWYAQTGLTELRWVELGKVGPQPNFTEQWSSAVQRTDPKLDVVYPTTFYPGVTDEHSAGELVMRAGDTQEVDVRVQAAPAVHLRVTNMPLTSANEPGPVIGANQKIFDSYSAGLPVVSGQIAPGVYEVAGLPPGDVTLTLGENRNGAWENRTMHTKVSEGESLDGSATGTTANVTGRVIPAGGSDVGWGGAVTLSSKGQSLARKLEKDGTFSFAGVEADTYEVGVGMGVGDEGEYVEQVTATGAKAIGQEVKIEGAGDVQLVVRMGRGLGEISGVVKKEGKERGGVMVLLVPETGEELERKTRIDQSDSDGTFTLAGVFPGKYVLMAIEDGWDLEWAKEEVLKPYREKGERVVVAAGEMKKVEAEEVKK